MDYTKEMDPMVREKMKKTLVYVGIFSIIMLFAGFTSAYIVMMGDSFWLKYPLPLGFWLSTTCILLSSLSFILAISSSRKNKQGRLKSFMALTLILGFGFIYFQFQGYNQLVDSGIHPVNNHVIVSDGKYGDYFEVKYKGDYIEVDGNTFSCKGKEFSEENMKEYQDFMAQFEKVNREVPLKVKNNSKSFQLYLDDNPVIIKNNLLYKNDTTKFDFLDELRLSYLAQNVNDRRGDFFVRGEFGKDFKLYFKGKELQYEDKILKYEGAILKPYLQIKAAETADSASSFLFILSFLHLLHVLIALLFLGRVTIHSFSGRFSSENNLSLRLAAIFWHFLGILWIYLLLFLVFIH
jgi:cytochrome c oxidase subunit III